MIPHIHLQVLFPITDIIVHLFFQTIYVQVPTSRSSNGPSVAFSSEPYDLPTKDSTMERALVDPEMLVRSIKLHLMQRSESVQTPGPLGLPTSPILTPAPREVQSTKVCQAWLPAADKGDTPKVSLFPNC